MLNFSLSWGFFLFLWTFIPELFAFLRAVKCVISPVSPFIPFMTVCKVNVTQCWPYAPVHGMYCKLNVFKEEIKLKGNIELSWRLWPFLSFMSSQSLLGALSQFWGSFTAKRWSGIAVWCKGLGLHCFSSVTMTAHLNMWLCHYFSGPLLDYNQNIQVIYYTVLNTVWKNYNIFISKWLSQITVIDL